MFDCIVIGGGAAGVFAAIQNPSAKILLLEKGPKLLAKVLCTGGGRCNLTNACYDLKELASHYPRGAKELLGPFHRFGPREMIDWVEGRGVSLKTEEGKRVFPISDRAETIVDLLKKELEQSGVEVRCGVEVGDISLSNGVYRLGPDLEAKALIIATGSSPDGYRWAKQLGHTVVDPIPSLFALQLENNPLRALTGRSCHRARVAIGKFVGEGPLLITHFGLSGPAILQISSKASRYLYEREYRAPITINWLPHLSKEQIIEELLRMKRSIPQKLFENQNPFSFSRKLWAFFGEDKKWEETSHKKLFAIAEKLCRDSYTVVGRSIHKEEFVTCGGVSLKEIDFRTMQSKCSSNLYFAGEILDIDGLTGGFNLQSAWTTGYIAGQFARFLV